MARQDDNQALSDVGASAPLPSQDERIRAIVREEVNASMGQFFQALRQIAVTSARDGAAQALQGMGMLTAGNVYDSAGLRQLVSEQVHNVLLQFQAQAQEPVEAEQ